MKELNSKIVLRSIFRGILGAIVATGTTAVMNKVEENKKTSADAVIEKAETDTKNIYQIDSLIVNQR